MSLEQLLFFLLILAIPLLERMIRATRARAGDSSDDHLPTPDEGTVSRPRSPVPLSDAGTTASEARRAAVPHSDSLLPPALPEGIPQVAPKLLLESGRESRTRGARDHGPGASPQARHSERATVVRPVITGGDLRRAIVLTTILGRCRALEPRDTSPLD